MRAKSGLIYFIILIAFVPAVSLGNEGEKVLAPLGLGVESCSDWIYHQRNRDQRAKEEDAWLGGFLTGFNAFADPSSRGATFFRYDMRILPGAISAQCKNNPKFDVYSAARSFLGKVKENNLERLR